MSAGSRTHSDVAHQQKGALPERVSRLCHQAVSGLSAASPMHHQQIWAENKTLGASGSVGTTASTYAWAPGDDGAAESASRTSFWDYQGSDEPRSLPDERP